MSQIIHQLIQDFARLPGIGERTAARLVYHLLREGRPLMRDFAQDLNRAMDHIVLCSLCQDFTEEDPCCICRDSHRRDDIICVLADPSTVLAVERTKAFRGKYHILHGLLSPLDGIGPEELRISSLLKRLTATRMEEIILALSTSVSGDATALYVTRLLQPMGYRVSRLSSGVPVGAELEYLDQMTLARALEQRVAV